MCSFPQLIAAYHVLHRLSDPRHPPCALISFKNLHFPYSAFASAVQIFVFMRLKTLSQYVKELISTKYNVLSTNVQMIRL